MREERSSPMKVLHYKSTMCLEEGGVVKAVLDLVRMGMRSDEVAVATMDPSGIPDEWQHSDDGSVCVHHLTGAPRRGMTLSASQLGQMRKIISENDVVHLHSMWNPANPQIAKLCIELGKPYVLSVHGMLDDWCMSQRRIKKVFYMKTWGRHLLQHATVVHCTAQAELDQASKWFDRSKGVSVPLPFDLDEYETLPGSGLAYETFAELDREKPKVLFLSRINYKKGVDRLIRASALLHAKGVEHQLVIAGTGDEPYVEQMRSLARSEKIEDQTYFLGFASGVPKVALLEACDVFALPTSQENFGFVFFEALASGTLVLTTKGTDTWPEIEGSGGGVIADNTPEAFADALQHILGDLQQTHAMGQAGRSWVYREMTVDRVRQQYRDMYQRCLSMGERS
ncbi:MAG: glycosyltransferase [Phycisphaerales bacterium JB047]